MNTKLKYFAQVSYLKSCRESGVVKHTRIDKNQNYKYYTYVIINI